MITQKRNFSIARLQKVASILKIIAHPVRLEILEALEVEQRLSVREIQDRIESPVEQSMLSHHLIKMKDNGILHSEKIGKQIFYSITEKQILSIFDCMEKCDF